MADFSLLTGDWLDQEIHEDDSTVLFTSTRRAQAVNDACEMWVDVTECLTRQSSVSVSCNVVTYDLLDSTVFGSSDFMRFSGRGLEYHLTDSNGTLTQLAGENDFPRRDIQWLNDYEPGWRQSTTPQMPQSYAVEEDDGQYLVRLYPPPDVGSSETASLVVPYIPRPAVLSNSTDVPFTVNGRVRTDLVPFHRAIVHGAAYLLEKLRGDTEASDRQLALFQGYVARYREKRKPRGTNRVRLAKSYLHEASSRRRGFGRFSGLDPRRWP